MFDVDLKITKHRLSDEHSSQLGAINAGQAFIMISVIFFIFNSSSQQGTVTMSMLTQN